MGNAKRVAFVMKSYRQCTDAFLNEKYRPLRHCSAAIDDERKTMKRQRRREIIAMRRIDPLQAMQRNTWYYLGINSVQQMLYCMKRINDPCREHVGNNFEPMPTAFHSRFLRRRDEVLGVIGKTLQMLRSSDFTDAEALRNESETLQGYLSNDRKELLDTMQRTDENITTLLLTIHILQESQELIGSLRHMIRGMNKFAGEEV